MRRGLRKHYSLPLPVPALAVIGGAGSIQGREMHRLDADHPILPGFAVLADGPTTRGGA